MSEAAKNEAIGGEDKYILRPSAGRIAIKVKEIERETKSGIVLLSDSHAPKPVVGTVVAVCDEYELENEDYDPLFKVGDIVIFGKYIGTRVQVDREIFIILRESDILARLVPSDGTGLEVDRDKVKVRDYTEQ